MNNENTPPKESPEYKLHKLGSLPETFSKTYQEYYTPERELVMNKQMVGMKCLRYVQLFSTCQKSQAAKEFGVKLWVLCEKKSAITHKIFKTNSCFHVK